MSIRYELCRLNPQQRCSCYYNASKTNNYPHVNFIYFYLSTHQRKTDVDFHALSKAVNQGSGGHQVKAYGPVNQGNYLASMGIVERVEQLIDDDETSEKQATDLYHALERLLLPDQMGERYQVLAIVKDDENNRNPPAGFQ